MEGKAMPGAEVMNIRDWRTRLSRRQPMTETTPLEMAAAFDGAAAGTFAALNALRSTAKQDTELQKNETTARRWPGWAVTTSPRFAAPAFPMRETKG